MITHFLTRDFSLADIPTCVAQHHRDSFENALRQRDIADAALQEALETEQEIGPEPHGMGKRWLQDAWVRYHDEHERYEAMVQEAMEELGDDYPYGINDHL